MSPLRFVFEDHIEFASAGGYFRLTNNGKLFVRKQDEFGNEYWAPVDEYEQRHAQKALAEIVRFYAKGRLE